MNAARNEREAKQGKKEAKVHSKKGGKRMGWQHEKNPFLFGTMRISNSFS